MRTKTESFFTITKITFYLAIYTIVVLFFVILSVFIDKKQNISASASFDNLPVIVIDAGHGGFDGGATGISGKIEKELNLEIAKYLSSLIKLSGFNCVMTRNDDSELIFEGNQSLTKKHSDLLARVDIAQKYKNCCFVSIHQNKFPSSKYKGLQVFYSKNVSTSRELAEKIKKNNQSLVDNTNKRDIKVAGKEIYILDKIKSPAVLVECGFLSNAQEEKLLSTVEYQKKIAFMLYSSIVEFIEENYKTGKGNI